MLDTLKTSYQQKQTYVLDIISLEQKFEKVKGIECL